MIQPLAHSFVIPQRGQPLKAKECSHSPQHGDCFVPSFEPPPIYSRSLVSQLALSTPQMGDFPSGQYTFGEEPAQQQTQWESNLGAVPKNCYYCTRYGSPTGKCSQDSGDWGSGINYMGEKCAACSGTGTCPRCNGTGVLGGK